jgi:predicted ATPase/DNA-binding winged helix-turn-helix (wHTH) protein
MHRHLQFGLRLLLNSSKLSRLDFGFEMSNHHTADWVITFGRFRVTKARRLLEKDDEAVHLGSRAFDILAHLLERSGQVVSHRDLLKAVWPDTNVEEGSLRFQVASLRKALGGQDGGPIVNISGRGYCFTAHVSRQNIKSQSASGHGASKSGPNPLPNPIRLFGRAQSISQISALVKTQRVVSVVAPGGMGKTSVAIVVASQIAPSFRDGVGFAELGPVEDPARIGDAIAAALGIPVRSTDALTEVATFLQSRRMLFVIDGCEHIIDAVADSLEQLVKRTEAVHILATSREALRIECEQVFHLEPLACSPLDKNLSPSEILTYPAIQLLVDRARAAIFTGTLEDGAKSAAEVCAKLDGLPLAIELAASQVKSYGLETLASMLEEQMVLNWRGLRSAPPRHQSLAAMLEWSYRLLAEEEKRLLRYLSVFAGSFDLEAAITVANSDVAQGQVAAVLSDLVSKSLVSVARSETGLRYWLLDTTKKYARGKLAEAGELDDLQRRHAAFYRCALVELGSVAPNPGLVARFAEQIENLRAAIAWAFSPLGNLEVAVDLVAYSIPVWEHLHLFQEERQLITKALSLTNQINLDVETQLVLGIGVARAIRFTSGLSDESRSAWSHVLVLAESCNKTDRQLVALINLLGQEIRQGNYGQSLKLAEQVQHLVGSAGARDWAGMGDWLIGVIKHETANYTEARIHLERALSEWHPSALATQIGLFGYDCRYMAAAHMSINYLLEGDVARAVQLAEQSFEQAHALEHGFPMANCRSAQAINYILLTDWDSAHRTARSLFALCEDWILGPFQAIARGYLSLIEAWLGDRDGIKNLDLSIAALKQIKMGKHVRLFEGERLRFLLHPTNRGNIESPLSRLDTSENGFAAWYLPEMIRLNGLLAKSEGVEDEAEKLLLASLELARLQGSPFWELRAANDLAASWVRDGRRELAHEALASALSKFSAGSASEDISKARSLIKAL